jgi:hypothetical protein
LGWIGLPIGLNFQLLGMRCSFSPAASRFGLSPHGPQLSIDPAAVKQLIFQAAMAGLASLRNGIKARGKAGILRREPPNGIDGNLEFLKGKAIGWVNSQFIRRLIWHLIQLDKGTMHPESTKQLRD